MQIFCRTAYLEADKLRKAEVDRLSRCVFMMGKKVALRTPRSLNPQGGDVDRLSRCVRFIPNVQILPKT